MSFDLQFVAFFLVFGAGCLFGHYAREFMEDIRGIREHFRNLTESRQKLTEAVTAFDSEKPLVIKESQPEESTESESGNDPFDFG